MTDEHRQAMAKSFAEYAVDLMSRFSTGLDPGKHYESAYVPLPGKGPWVALLKQTHGLVWYGHDGAMYFACSCNHRFERGLVGPALRDAVYSHYLECKGAE